MTANREQPSATGGGVLHGGVLHGGVLHGGALDGGVLEGGVPGGTVLDGNAAGGMLAELFAVDVTAAVGQCAYCGDRAPVAASRVYPGGPGLTGHCRLCGEIMFRVVRGPDRAWLDLRGLVCLELTVPDAR
jgi:hypothetical protein